MKQLQRVISLLLALVLTAGMVPPVAVRADETEPTQAVTEAVVETTAPMEVATEPVAATTAPTEAATEPVEETTVPTEAVTEPVEETTAPTEAVTEPTVDTTVPTEKETAGAQTMADAVAVSTVASGTCGENVTWTLDDAGTLTIAGTGAMADYTTSSTSPWYACRTDITDVIIADGVTSIGNAAFYQCTSLKNITIPQGLKSIGNTAFHYCTALTDVAIPDSVVSIGETAFRMSGLKSISIPEGVQTIGYRAFYRCGSLSSVSIPASVSSIGDDAFCYCESLNTITVDSQNQNYSSIDGVLFAGAGDTLLTYPTGRSGSYIIPEGVRTIGSNSFFSAALTGVTVPESVISIGVLAFDQCGSLKEIVFKGDAPAIDAGNYANPEVFYGVTATVYYPEGNSTWTEEIMQSYGMGATLTWESYTPDEEPEEKACRLEELTDIDYLAFSRIAYKSFGSHVGKTIEQALIDKNIWEDWFIEDQGITYADLCKHIAKWKVYDSRDDSNYSGFYAVAFENDDEEVVIAYRGSTKPWKMLTSKDGWGDWILNDLPTQLFNHVFADNNQYELGFEFYEQVLNDNTSHHKHNVSSIAVTGHSLGGGLGNIVSARYGCKGVTFNAICIIDAIYEYLPSEMGMNFDGIDEWNFVDHPNQCDALAGMFEYYVPGKNIKPFIAHYPVAEVEPWWDELDGKKTMKYILETVTDIGLLFLSHSMETYVIKDAAGNVRLTDENERFFPSKPITKIQSIDKALSLDLGTSKDDVFNKGFSVTASRLSFGGMGMDDIYSSVWSDRLFGGKGNDTLDGLRGNDVYIYYKGDGYDTIFDVSGADSIKLMNFSDDDVIEARSYDDSDYINILCNGEAIISIYKKNRDYRWNAIDSFFVHIENSGNVIDITELFSKKAHNSYVEIYCPVNVEVMDSAGNVVYTLMDGEVGAYYTDYGNFYIFEEENGGYGKILDLIEGYTARIVGHDDGTMKINYRDVVDGELAEAKNFVDVPISAEFSATFEETEDGELVLAADTDGDGVVDAKIGYDGKPVPADAVQIDREYVALKPGETVQLTAKAQPAELTELIQWSMEKDDETVASVDQKGLVTANSIGTAYVIASVTDGETTATARCRIDVAETEVPEDGDGSGEEIEPVIKIDGIQLSTTKVTSELYSSDYAQFDLLLKLPQNISIMSTEDRPIPESNGVAIEEAWFVESGAKAAFNLVPLDDRRIALVPTEEALENPSGLAKSYKSQVTVVVDGWEYTTVEEMSITLKQSKPKLKATVPAFNAFYTGQTHQITITGGTVTDIAGKEIPEWLTLNSDGALSLNKKAGTKNSGKAVLLVDTEEWIIPAEVSLSVKNAYKVPGLKLSAASVKMAANAADSSGVALKLLPKSKKDTLAGLNVRGIAVADEFKYNIEDFNPETGAFILKAENGFQTGTIVLNVSFSDTQELLQLKLKVTNQTVSLKLSPTTVTLNKRTGDQAQVKITAAPADYKLTALDVKGNEVGELEIAYENGILTVGTKEETKAQTYALSVSAGGSRAVALKVKVTEELPVVTLKAKSGIDLSFPDRMVSVVPTFKNYAGGEIEDYTAAVIAPDGTATEAFDVSYEDGAFLVECRDTEIVTGTYRLKLTLQLNNNVTLEANTKLGVKRTAVKLKLTPGSLTLNKMLGDQASVAVACITKGYDFREQPDWELRAKNKKDSAEGKLDIKWEENKLQIAVNTATESGATYYLQVQANEHAPAVNLAIKIVDVIPTVSLKASGTVDVIRNGTSILVTPTYRNCMDLEKREKLNVYSSADRFTEPVEGLFHMDRDDLGRFVLTAAPGLDHTKSYKVELESTVGGVSVKSAKIPVRVKMGSAKLTLNADGNVMFGNDCKDRIQFCIATGDNALNSVEKVVSRDVRFEVVPYENGEFALAFRDGIVNRNLPGKSVMVSLDVFLKGNETVTAEKAKPNATLKLKVRIVK